MEGARRAWLAVVVVVAGVACDEVRAPMRPAPERVAPAPTAVAPRVPLPGPCVDPAADFRARVEGEIWQVALEETIDLDGDGRADLTVADRGRCGSGDCSQHHVYVRRGGCAHFVGVVGGQGLAARSGRSKASST